MSQWRTASYRHYYTKSHLRIFLGFRPSVAPCATVACCRVSCATLRSDLVNQRRALKSFIVARGVAGADYLDEVGGVVNFGRKRLLP